MKKSSPDPQSARSPAWSLLLRVLCLAGLFYFGLLIFTLVAANPLIFPSPPPSYHTLPGQVALRTDDGVELAAVWLPREGAVQTILYSHGNGEDLGRCLPHLEHLADLGFNVFSYDYRGYGRSQGQSGEQGVYYDIQTAWNFLVHEQKIAPESILIYGRSLGSGPSTWLAAREPAGGLILDSAYTSTFKTVLPWLWFPNDKFPNLSRINRVRAPVLVMHGSADEVISFNHGEKLFQAAPEPKRHLWVEGAGHNNLIDQAGPRYDQAILELAQIARDRAYQPSK